MPESTVVLLNCEFVITALVMNVLFKVEPVIVEWSISEFEIVEVVTFVNVTLAFIIVLEASIFEFVKFEVVTGSTKESLMKQLDAAYPFTVELITIQFVKAEFEILDCVAVTLFKITSFKID